MVPEQAYVDTWQNPYVKDPFHIPLERQLDLLLAADARDARVKGVTLAETSMQFRRIEQWFASSTRLAHPSGQDAVRRGHRGHEFRRRRNSEALLSQ